MRKEYVEELEQLKSRMIKAELFANKIKVFSEKILKNKYNESDYHINLGPSLGKVYLGWDIFRRSYRSSEISNYVEEFSGEKILFRIYINSYSLFDVHNNFSLNSYITEDLYFYLDNLNSTYYVDDSCIDAFSDQLEKWFTQAKEKSKEYKTNLQIKELEAKLKDLKG